MHIALVAPLVSVIHDDVTPLGGAQTFVIDLAHGLIQDGHRVTLLAADGSAVRGATIPELGIDAKLLTPADFNRPKERVDTDEQSMAFQRVREWIDAHASDIDIVHGHAYDGPCFTSLYGASVPIVHTLHLPPIDPGVVLAVTFVQERATYTAVSETSATQWRQHGVDIHSTIYPGLDLEHIPYRSENGTFLLFAGRMTPEKGPDQAIDVAESLGHSILLVGDVYDRAYFDRSIAPRARIKTDYRPGDPLQSGATYIGPRPRVELLEIMSRAEGVLMPSTWDEPFGLVGIEAQATGTPVAAYRRGGLAEVVADGETGWLVTPDDRAELLKRAAMLKEINRHQCRARVEKEFSMRNTVNRFMALYSELIACGPRRAR